jgi:hypothetical protein
LPRPSGGLVARSIDRLDKPAAAANVRALGEKAWILSAPGVDPIYGHGQWANCRQHRDYVTQKIFAAKDE